MFVNPTEYLILIISLFALGWFARGSTERIIKFLKKINVL